jgi:hypothetical protein
LILRNGGLVSDQVSYEGGEWDREGVGPAFFRSTLERRELREADVLDRSREDERSRDVLLCVEATDPDENDSNDLCEFIVETDDRLLCSDGRGT